MSSELRQESATSFKSAGNILRHTYPTLIQAGQVSRLRHPELSKRKLRQAETIRLVTFPLKIRKAGTDASVQSGPTFPAGVGSVGSGNKRGFGIGFSVGFAGRSGKRGIAVTILLPRAISLSQVGPDMNEVVGDHRESDPATDAVRPFIE